MARLKQHCSVPQTTLKHVPTSRPLALKIRRRTCAVANLTTFIKDLRGSQSRMSQTCARPGRVSGVVPRVSEHGSPSAELEVYDAVVVGGGISGLAVGQALKSKHGASNFLVTEARGRVGGNIISQEANGYIWEEGPNSFEPSDALLQIMVDAGVEKDIIFADPKAPRFVYWDGKLHDTPFGMLDLLVLGLFSPWGKLRAVLGAAGIMRAGPPGYEESVEQLARRNLGAEVYERLVEPFCSGIYAGDPSKLSMQAAFPTIWSLEAEGGSLLGGILKRLWARRKSPAPAPAPGHDPAELPAKPKGQTVGSFRHGMSTLSDAVGRNIKDNLRLNWKLSAISKQPSGLYYMVYNTPEGSTAVEAKMVALTVPSYTAAELLQPVVPACSQAVQSIDYPPVAAVTLSYPLSAIREDRKDASGKVPGFGQLHPRSKGITTLGTLYSSSLFPGRCPEGQILLYNFVGGTTNRGIVNQSQEQIVEQVDKDLRVTLLKPGAPQPKVLGVRVWPRAIPQFNIGHSARVQEALSALREAGWDGFMLGGSYVSGVALGRCVEHGYMFAADIARRMQADHLPAA